MVVAVYRGWKILLDFSRDERDGWEATWPRIEPPFGKGAIRVGDEPMVGRRPALVAQAMHVAQRKVDELEDRIDFTGRR